jgi:hypothetical protein
MIGLFCLIFTAHQLQKVFRAHHGVAQKAMFYCFLVGGILPIIEFLQNIGVVSMANWMATE